MRFLVADDDPALAMFLARGLETDGHIVKLASDGQGAMENFLREMPDDTFSTTASSSESLLQVADSALGNVVTQLTSAISLATQANNGVLNSSNLQSVSTELTGIRDEVLSLANSSYLGRYIFSGSQGGTQPFTLDSSITPNTVTYNGDGDVSYVETPAGQNIQLNVPGDQIFTAAGASVLGSLNALIADFSSGSGPSATSVADLASLSSALGYVDQQRAVIDNSLNRLTTSANYASSESVQLLSAQNSLIQTDTASVATQLSTAETQQAALTQVIAALDQQGNLFQSL